MKRLARWITAAIIALMASDTGACFAADDGLPPHPTPSSPAEVTLQLKWHHQFQFAGFYAAVEKGFYARAGLKVALIQGGPGICPVDEVAEGNADFGVTGAQLVSHRIKGVPVVLLASIFQHSAETIFVRTDRDIATLHDLAAHPIAGYTPHEDLAISMLRQEGVDAGKLALVDSADRVGDFVSGKVAAFKGYLTNEAYALQKAGIAYHTIAPAYYGFDFYGDSLFTSEAFLIKNPEIVRRFRDASLEGWRYAVDHPDELVDVIKARYCPSSTVEKLAFEAQAIKDLMVPDLVEIGHFSRARWHRIAQTYARFRKMAPDAVDLKPFFFTPHYTPYPNRYRHLAVFLGAAGLLLALGSTAMFVFNHRLRSQVETQTHAIREKENEYRILFEASRDAIIICGPDGTCLGCNPAAVNLFGCSRDALVGARVYDFSPAYQPCGRCSLSTAAEILKRARAGEPTTVYWQHQRANGTLFDSEVTVSRVCQGRQDYIFCVIRDVTEKRKNEQILKEHEEQYRHLFENSMVGLWRTRISDGRFLKANQQTAIILGYRSAEEVVEKCKSTMLYPPGIRDDFVRRMLEGTRPQCIETIFRLSDGTVKNIAIHAKAYPDQGYLEGALIDITQRKKAEELAREAFEISRDILYKLDLKSMTYEYVSPAVEMLTGVSVEEALRNGYQRFKELVHPDDLKKLPDHMAMITSATPEESLEYSIEYRMKTLNGGYRWFNDRHVVLFDPDGSPRYKIGNSRDITDIRESEKKRLESERKFRNLFNSSPDGIAITDLDGTLSDVNPSFLDITGEGYDDIVQRNFLELTPEKYHAKEAAIIEKLQKGAISHRPFETEYLRRDGTTIPIAIRGWLVTDVDNHPIGLGGFVRDISKDKALAKEKERLEAQLRQTQKMEAIGTLAGGIAHDFNNILGGILGYTELLMEDIPAENDSQHEFLTHVYHAGLRAKDLVNQILAFSRQNKASFKPLEIRPIVKEALKLLRSTIPKTIEIEEKLAIDTEKIVADATQVHQVLMNLCTNAFQAMRKEGGRLSIGLDRVFFDTPKILTGARLGPGHFLRLKVADTGRGIAPDDLPQIFTPYFTTRRREDGTGLGLSVTLGIVKSHGGAIEVDTTPGRGTTFNVYLPLVKSQSIKEKITERPIPGGTERILVVDDERFYIDVVDRMLSGLGYRVTTTSDSVEALKLIKAEPQAYDLVISDQTMPNLTGVELSAAVSKIRPGLPIILCTGFSEQVDEKSAPDFGISKFVMKPVIRPELAQSIREVLQ